MHPTPILCNLLEHYQLRSDLISLELPFYDLDAKSKRVPIIKYKNDLIAITHTGSGRPTIKDKEIVIYCLSQARQKFVRGAAPSNVFHVCIYDFLRITNRGSSGCDYARFESSLVRLQGADFEVISESRPRQLPRTFKLIESFSFDNALNGYSVQIVLATWLIDCMTSKNNLTLSPAYFAIKQPIARRLYEICRQKCGSYNEQKLTLDNVAALIGTNLPRHKLKKIIQKIADDKAIPDFELKISKDILHITKIVKKPSNRAGFVKSC